MYYSYMAVLLDTIAIICCLIAATIMFPSESIIILTTFIQYVWLRWCPRRILYSLTIESCEEGTVQISGFGEGALAGHVEVCIEQSWTTICDETWDDLEASVVCRQLGFSPHGKYYIHDNVGPLNKYCLGDYNWHVLPLFFSSWEVAIGDGVKLQLSVHVCVCVCVYVCVNGRSSEASWHQQKGSLSL